MRCNFKETQSGELMEELNNLWSNVRGKHNHEFSFLYNAHVEKHYGETFYTKYRGRGIKQVYADSGGLQIITLGLTNTPELKQNVYKAQGQYSDCAMSFDEIPVSVIGTRSSRSDITNKYFDRNKFEWCARESGRNIKNQIETFIEMGSEAKPFFIAQGHDLETYVKWTEYALEEIPEELHEYIGGVAMGSAGMGTGVLEDCKRAFFFTQLPLFGKVNHLHLLGIGSVARMVPTLAMIRAGLYNDVHVSYDSTSHTSGIEMGRYYGPNFKWISYSRHFGIDYININNDIKKLIPEWEMSDELLHYSMNESVRRYQKKHDDVKPPILAYNAAFVGSVINFINHLNKVNNDFKLVNTLMSEKMYGAMDAFSTVKTSEQFKYWEKEVGRYLPSQSIRDGLPATLPEDF